MKTRSGFVSNSSTSSFVFLGYEIKKKDFDVVELGRKLYGNEVGEDAEGMKKEDWFDYIYDKEEFEVINDMDDGAPSNGIVLLGKTVAQFSDDCDDTVYVDLDDFIRDAEELKKRIGLDHNVKLKFLLGTRCC